MPLISTLANASARGYGMFGGVAASANSYESIATYTATGSVSTISFSSIPSTFKHLQLRYIAASTRATYGFDSLTMTLNSDSGANYSSHQLIGDGSAASATGYSSTTYMLIGDRNIGAAMPNTFGAGVIDLLDYQNTSKYKTIRSLSGVDNNGTYDGTYYPQINFMSGSWRSTSAVSSVSFSAINGNFKQYSSFALYGIKG